MASARKREKQRRRARKLGDCVRQFLTPAVWKQVQNAARPWQACKLHFADHSIVGKQKGGVLLGVSRGGINQVKEEAKDGH